MTAIAEKLKAAGVDTFEARFAVLAIEALRAHPDNIEAAWRLIGERFGHQYLRERAKDMRGPKKEAFERLAEAAREAVSVARGETQPLNTPKPYVSRVVSLKKTAARREKLFERVRSKFKCHDGRYWSEVGWHELAGMTRQGAEARALLAAGPANVPNDERTIADVIGVTKIDQIIIGARTDGR